MMVIQKHGLRETLKISEAKFVHEVYYYPNCQRPTTLWYHDHALGITRLNVYAGLAGFYLIRDAQRRS